MDEFRQAAAELSSPGVRGWWERVLVCLSDDQRESLLAAAASRDISHRAIAVVLGRWGYPVTLVQVGHWRRNHLGQSDESGNE